ncbi:unnamed protein product [Orchesella dallaii]|uniref:EB domain-containing protein n=1 Tax=Orchesella dallaii TaxID=48710 RepID=A0ABP1PVC5_9HEXA
MNHFDFKTLTNNLILLLSFVKLLLGSDFTDRELIGFPCTFTEDCVGIPDVSSECSDWICSCKSGYIPSTHLDACLELQSDIGKECLEDQQCSGKLKTCINGSCDCVDGAIPNPANKDCYITADRVGDDCEMVAQCTVNLGPNSECSRGICMCSINSLPSKDGSRCVLEYVPAVNNDSCSIS